MMKRGPQARDENGRWDIVGGGLKFGLKIEENLQRELQEEICTKPIQLDFMGIRDVHRTLEDGTPTHWVALDYLALVDPREVKIGEPGVIDQIGWFTLDTVPSPVHSQFDILIKNNRERIEAVLGILNH